MEGIMDLDKLKHYIKRIRDCQYEPDKMYIYTDKINQMILKAEKEAKFIATDIMSVKILIDTNVI